jgi:hypothetical protein
MKRLEDLDKLSDVERMKIALQLVRTYRRMNYPDVDSLLFIDSLINELKVAGFSEEEIRYAIERAYMKRIRKYESQEQYSHSPQYEGRLR